MKWLNVLAARARAMFHRDAVIDDIDEEMRIHVEMQTEANVARGLALDEARREALRSFGHVRDFREIAYDIRGGGHMETLLQDIRFGVRMLVKSPTFTAVALLMIAIGIGANAAIFSAVNGVLLNPLPFAEPDRIVMVWGNFRNLGLEHISVSVPEYVDYRDRAQSFSSTAAFATGNFNLTGDGEPERVEATATTASLFRTLGVQSIVGRTFTEQEDTPGNDHVVVLSYGVWQRRFGADAGVVGQPIMLDNEPFTVVGVMPETFDYPADTDIWVPIAFDPPQASRGSRFLNVIGRLGPGVSVAQAQSEMATLSSGFMSEYPNNYPEKVGWGASVTTLSDEIVGDIRPALLVLLGAVGLVLLIACANMANLLLARASVRQREIAIRAALGAGRGRVVRQLLVESLLLSVVGGVAGLLTATWGVSLLTRSIFSDVPRAGDIGLDWKVLLFSTALSLGTGILFGLAPALKTSGLSLNELLREGGRGGSTGPKGNRLRNALVVAEVALALMLVVGAGLMMRSFASLWQIDAGFKADRVMTMEVSLPQQGYAESAQANTLYQNILDRTSALPGVQSAALTTILPLVDNSSGSITIEGRPVNTGEGSPEADFRVVSSEYFRTMGIDLVEGRGFETLDTPDTLPVAIVDETLARQLFPPGAALGGRLKPGGPQSTIPWMTVVGIVRHVRNQGLDQEGRYQLYFPYTQSPATSPIRNVTLVARSSGDVGGLAGPMRSVVQAADPNLPVAKIRTMDEIVSQSVVARRLPVVLLGVFAGVALLLAVLGLYGVISYSVTQRTTEIGIRMALGANPVNVLLTIVKHGLMLSLVGVAIGLVGAFALTRMMDSLLFGVSATDPVTFGVTAIVLLVVAVVASLIPARRAARVDPLIALHNN